jgi:hypothetical protein
MEIDGLIANLLILAMQKLDDSSPSDDAIPWCSAFVNFVAFIVHLA